MGRRASLKQIVCTQTNSDSDPHARKVAPSMALLLGLMLCGAIANACSGGTTPSQPDGGALCAQGSNMCSADTQCTNANCVPTCQADGGCASGFYCESETAPFNVCSPNRTTDCASGLDCPAPQSCVLGSCVVTELGADGGTLGCNLTGLSNGSDGCAPDSICYAFPNTATGGQSNYCLGLPHCGATGRCPVDPYGFGSVCNTLADGGQLFPGKERLCLLEYCADSSNCPTGFACFHRDPSTQLGQCQTGTIGNPCYANTDCFNATQCEVDGGLPDDGGTLGACH